MPRVTIWIRKEDWDKWTAIDNKPTWLHDKINQVPIAGSIPTVFVAPKRKNHGKGKEPNQA